MFDRMVNQISAATTTTAAGHHTLELLPRYVDTMKEAVRAATAWRYDAACDSGR